MESVSAWFPVLSQMDQNTEDTKMHPSVLSQHCSHTVQDHISQSDKPSWPSFTPQWSTRSLSGIEEWTETLTQKWERGKIGAEE